jgi:cellulose synthase/poly-beta-1,6-N-acetylglucosamine synthase-like glycosyltransferase
MRTNRVISFISALLLMIPLLVIPSYIGLSISDGKIELSGFEKPDDPMEYLTFRMLDIYYLLFILLNVFPFMLLVFWSFGARSEEKKYRSMVKKGMKFKKGNKQKVSDLFSGERYPLVSVIIPCYNEDRYLGAAVTNAYRQSYPGKIEIIVIDDGSNDNTWSIGKIFQSGKGKRNVKIFHKPNGGKASAISNGIEKASGKIIITTDGDSEMHEDAVRELVLTFKRYPDAGIVGGFVSIKNSHKGYLTKLQQLEYFITQHMIRMNQSEDGSVLIAPGPIFGMRADLAKLFPPMDRTIVEDCDLTMSILPTGYTTRSTANGVSQTNCPETWEAWFKQRRRWIYGQFQAWRENKWHLKKNPWGLYTYFTWIATSLSALLFILGLTLIFTMVATGRDYYSYLEFVSLRTIIVFGIYFILRSMIVLSYKETRRLILWLPLKMVYDMINGILTGYLYFRFISGMGVKMIWGNREEVVN